VPGGGLALLFSAKALDGMNAENRDQKVGIEIVRKAVEAPTRQIAENAGAEGSIVVSKIRERNDETWGFDAATGEYKDMFEAGIIDPTKVVRTTLQDAASVADLVVTTEAMVASKPEPQPPAMPPGGGGMDF
jgi:chaperonin GroEL